MSKSETAETTDHRSDKAAKVTHFTTAERVARGKAARAEVPRKSHGEWEPALHRPDPVELLEEQASSRVPELVPIRYGRMLVSPFTFYRGAAYLMASDLADGPRSGLHVQLCGDAHLSNFGVYAAPDRRLVFSINDFDETLPGPFEWDVKRLVASFAVAGRDRGFDTKTRAKINAAVSVAYREAMHSYAEMRNLDIWYDRIDLEAVMTSVRGHGHRRAEEAHGQEPGQGANEGQPVGVQQADRDRRRRAADHRQPAADRPTRRTGRLRRRRSAFARAWPASSAHTGGRSRATGGSCSSGSASSMRPARSWAWAAWGHGPGFC